MQVQSLSVLTLLADEGQTPGEDVHEVGQPVGVRAAVELPNVHHVVLILQNGSLDGWREGEPYSDAFMTLIRLNSIYYTPCCCRRPGNLAR